MNIEMSFDRTVNIKRLAGEDESGDGRESYSLHLSDVNCLFQPLDDTFTQDIDGDFGKDTLMFCNVLDILEGDRIIAGEIEYRVVGVESFNFLGQERHMEIRIRQFND